jgi:hypothetical protein
MELSLDLFELRVLAVTVLRVLAVAMLRVALLDDVTVLLLVVLVQLGVSIVMAALELNDIVLGRESSSSSRSS